MMVIDDMVEERLERGFWVTGMNSIRLSMKI